MKIAQGIFLLISFTTSVASQDLRINVDSAYIKKFYKEFSRNLRKQVKDEFKELTVEDSIWIPLSLYNGGRSYGVISNYANYPEPPTFNLADTTNYSIDCMVFGLVENKKKDNSLYSVRVLVKDVCGLDSLGGKYSSLVKAGHIFDYHLFSFFN
ncbi:hypothetical protein FNH22_30635 [Fulvivirga sp. M361]|uniref:hypothetical protein n=1 Tax=Fulvivirga sp. M361 TaxID=2594266 RepID=UPI00117BD8F6|nr:hypothetical protein [Fulvivirga sp. M361]TRX47055.1 hypothetical protein FNH22_30635 [Fulvivirga sp. M361]